jgi:tetratricopeptide (TPR) repeat protein
MIKWSLGLATGEPKSEDSIFQEGITLFQKKEYKEASNKFRLSILEDAENVSGYFNLGVSLVHEENYSEAIWAFEKANKLAPGQADIRSGLDQCYQLINDAENRELEISPMSNLIHGKSSHFWSILAICMSAFLAIAVVLFVLFKSSFYKKVSLAGGILSLTLLITFMIFARKSYSFLNEHSHAVVTSKKAATYQIDKTLRNDSISGGSKVEFVDSVDAEFMKIKTSKKELLLIKLSDIRLI